MGIVAGVPDVLALKAGQIYGLELKAERGRLSQIQRETMEAMKAAGAIVEVAFGLDTALSILERWGLLKAQRQ